MRCQSVGQPCRNFQILGIERFREPRGGGEKVVLSNFAAGSTGCLVLVDPATGEGETLALPGDSGAWALLNWRDEKLLVGTCGQYGYLHCLDLASRTWAEPLRDPHETYIWNLCLGSDGMVYGGTYPGCVLLRYDPARHRLANLGRVSDNPDNLYSRMVYGGIPGHLLVACSAAEPHLALWSLASGTARRFGRPGATLREITADFICTQTDGELDLYDPRTFEPLEGDLSHRLAPPARPLRYAGMGFSVALAGGGVLAVRGQEYYVDAGGPEPPALRPIPAARPPTSILTLVADAQGRLWGSAGFGQTIFRFDPRTGETWNSEVVCDRGGEVYGMAWARGRLHLACYSGGDHVVYDPSLPWDQLGNVNPRALEPAPRLIRPAGKSVVGPDGHVWTGWMAPYGVYGGGLSRVDVETLQVTCWHDPVPGQAVAGVAADETYLYLITSGAANGLPTRQEPLHFAVWSPAGHVVWEHTFAPAEPLHFVAASAGRVLLAVADRIEVFDPAALRFERSLRPDAPCHHLARLGPERVAAFCGDELWRIDPASG
ncbi:MAG: hypothetical protein AB1505_19790, partial [Candidatus Latescibacterota bacterium]